jgi:hypothetical protein
MSSSDLILNIVNVLDYAPLLALFYAAYWAFDIRHALTVRLYRNQAFGLGLFSIVITLAALPSPLIGSSGILGSTWFLIGYTLVTSAFWLGTVYFVDASVLATRRSDPLLRDTIHWSKVRYVLWAFQIFNVSFILLGVTFSAITGNTSLANQIMQGNNGAFTSAPAIIANLPWGIAFGSFAVFIPVAIRAKDPSLRRHFKWLAVLTIVVGLLFIAMGIIGSYSGESLFASAVGTLVGNSIFFGIAGYCLYRSAKALVPLNRIPKLEDTN